jgi:hypothetical protein
VPFLGNARVVDDPRLNGAVAFNHGKHHLANFRQDCFVRPAPLANKMQQRLMLGRRPFRGRRRRHRFHALALHRQQQARTIIAQGPGSVRMSNHPNKPLNVLAKTRRNAFNAMPFRVTTHPSLLAKMNRHNLSEHNPLKK